MLDIIIIVFLLFGAIRGYIKGFFIQSLTLVALGLGIWAGIKLNPFVSELLMKIFGLKSSFTTYISFTILFVAVIVAVHFLGILLTRILDKSVIGTLNHIGGAIFGLVKLAFLLSVIFFLIQKFDRKEKLISKDAKNNSRLYGTVSSFAPAVFPHIDFEKVKKGILGN